VLGAEHDTFEVDGHNLVVLLECDVGEWLWAHDAGDVEDRVDAAECLNGSREHRFDIAFHGHIAPERHHVVAELGRRFLLSPADVGGEHARTFANENPRGGTRDP
jgi:hypothetical protein